METPVPNGIQREFLISPFQEFIKEYDIALAQYFEVSRLFKYKGEDPDPLETEKEFIRDILEFLVHRNEFLLELDKKDTEEIFEQRDLPIEEIMKIHSAQMEKEEALEFRGYNYKIHFLSVKIRNLGFEVDFREGITFNEIKGETPIIEEVFSRISGPEKLVYLKELGIIDFLKDQNPTISQNKIADLLSLITGVRYLQPTLQAMLSEDRTANPKNPYNNKKTAPKVRNQLIQWGFKIK